MGKPRLKDEEKQRGRFRATETRERSSFLRAALNCLQGLGRCHLVGCGHTMGCTFNRSSQASSSPSRSCALVFSSRFMMLPVRICHTSIGACTNRCSSREDVTAQQRHRRGEPHGRIMQGDSTYARARVGPAKNICGGDLVWVGSREQGAAMPCQKIRV